ncbi:J domain-containing protein [Pseudomonas putida]|uniref:J domain-containing protein n=1 Tax=Pseudomonas putida TaxID=303 RepID=UPI0023674093|nr:J domain-containing protein [Pseudomonas putida]MDD2050676.1 J domain-containing protein [Pseudomonas putida]
MNHWQFLDLTPGADERSIKRAYARLLKIHRPDESPEAFQRLREAYETSLAEARWRAQVDEQVEHAPVTASEPAPDCSPPALPMEHVDIAIDASPPEPSLTQMQQWLTEGKDRQVLDALQHWLASAWLLPFERRQQFEQDLLDWLESAPHWSPAFFDDVCKAMGWDETQGNLPCEHWRWEDLTRRCEIEAMVESVRSDLARFDANQLYGKPAALLFKPLNDCRRRELADYFTESDWQRFTQLAQAIEYQYPELPERLGLKPLDNWRDWLPPESYRGVNVFLWLSLAICFAAYLFGGPAKRDGIFNPNVAPLLMVGMLWFGTKAYQFWSTLAMAVRSLDVRLSQRLLPRRGYRQGAGLLVLRHVLPSVVPAALAFSASSHVPWMRWASPVVVFFGTLYFTNAALVGGRVPIWTRVLNVIKRQAERLPWHLLKREGIIVVVAVLTMGIWVYTQMKPVA